MKKSIFILFLLLFSASITAENDPFVCVHRALIIPQLDFTITLENDTIFYVVEVPPEFPGGIREMQRFINGNLRWPTIYNEITIQGTVIVGFTVEKDGSITRIEVVRNQAQSRAFAEEAIRVIEKMPKWTPGKQNGEPVRVRVIVPVGIRFQ